MSGLTTPYRRTIAGAGENEIEIKKSRFICTLARVKSEPEARAAIELLRKRYWDANHNCYAWVIGDRGDQQKANDDGEPSGTAGVPMLEVLRKRHLTDTLAVVTRYFGGTLLGAGGLIRAYGQAVTDAINVVGVVELRPLDRLIVRAAYDDAGRFENTLRASSFPLAAVDYGAAVSFTVDLPPEEVGRFSEWLAETSGGTLSPEYAGTHFVEVMVDDEDSATRSRG